MLFAISEDESEIKDLRDREWFKLILPISLFRKKSSRFMHSKTAATRPLPIERASKYDLMAILTAYQVLYSNSMPDKTPTLARCAEV